MHFLEREPIHKGWSRDKKYCATDESGRRYLLRVSELSAYDVKQAEFQMMKQVAELGIPMCQPIEFGVCDEGIYSIQSWIDGVDAEDAMKVLSDEERYRYGFEAGQILRKIHTIPAPELPFDWETGFNKKLDRKLKQYAECSLKYENGQLFVDYINENRHLLQNRPMVYQHGDYHRGNMMIGKDGNLYIIDFDRYDFGDPWEDLKAITWDVETSPVFACGRINGYFENEVPELFWKTLALYISCGILSSLPWAIPFGETEIMTMRTQAREVLSWYDNMQNPIPNWYMK